ncbi:hypothetical protein C8R43DRAFT_1153347 [Mycena crocata]|nr:hypothetical protein C8R43DRAFT_1153347 [Mycena crocata]
MDPKKLHTRLAAVLADISEQKRILDELEGTRQHIQCQLDSMIDPVSNFPVEIASEIFVCCLPGGGDVQPPSYAMEAPMLLLRVCTRWRDIALATPALWAQLHLDPDGIPGGISEVESFAADWLARAGDHPLSFIVSGWEPGNIGFIWRHANRMQSLELHAGVEDFYPLVEAGALHSLERLTLGLPFDDADASDITIDAFLDAPRLRELHLTEGFFPSYAFLPWRQLTKFTGTDFTAYECLEVLQLIPHLIECTFSVVPLDYYVDPGPDQSLIITHSHLKSLSFEEPSKPGGCDTILPYLTLPALETLHHVHAVIHFPRPIFQEFLARSSPPLKRFAFCVNYKDSPWEELLRQTPTLTDVELWYAHISVQTEFFQKLTWSCNGGRKASPWGALELPRYSGPPLKPFLPRLESILIVEVPGYGPSYDHEVMVKALKSRTKANNPFAKLTSLCITTEPDHNRVGNSSDIGPALAELEAQGIAVRIQREQ